MRFTIRDLLLVTVIVALAVGWFVENRQKNALKQENEALQMGNELMSSNWDKIVNELDAKRQQLGEPVTTTIEADPSEEIRVRELGSGSLSTGSLPAPNPPKNP